VGNTRLKSSFIYLANAVNDLRGNWATLALVLAPLVLVAALCLLPDAMNIQQGLAARFAPGTHSVGWTPVQEPYLPSVADAKPLFAPWMLTVFHLGFLLIIYLVNLLVLCTLRRAGAGARRVRRLNEALEIYRDAIRLAPGFFWIVFLQLAIPALALFLWRINIFVSVLWLALVIDAVELVMVAAGGLLYTWLYFGRYALVFDSFHSFHALLFSRELMRKRFFRVAMRIVVFLALWSGYDSWAAGFFVMVSVVLGPVGVLAGYLWATIFLLDLAAVAVTCATAAFFAAAGVRLYQDLREMVREPLAADPVQPPTAPLGSITA